MHRLSVHDLCVTRADRVLVPAVNFVLEEGELLHLRGANGCGKTSLLEIVAGLRRSDEGAVLSTPEEMARHWVGHRNALAPHLSAQENLSFWCGLNGVDSAGVQPSLERMAVPRGARRRPVRTLSAGQKRRSALSRLLLESRPLWLLDEPLDGLDRDGIAIFSEVLRAHLLAGGMVLMTSHQALPEGLPRVREFVLDGEGKA